MVYSYRTPYHTARRKERCKHFGSCARVCAERVVQAEEDSEGSESGQSGDHSPSINGEENDESGADLDASMEDRDDGNSDEVDEDMTDSEYEEEPSDI